MARLLTFARERFPLSQYVPMVGVYAFGNAALVSDLAPDAPFAPLRFALVWPLALLYFFRLRCFDEIKDHAFDLQHNPERPLARGLVTRRDLGTWIAVAFAAEWALAFALAGARGLAIHGVAQAYSLLMFREFFIGRWLRPHLTTYAVTHTLSAALLGASVGLLYTEGPVALDGRVALVLLFNWCLFNLFEFARKTWAPAEERPHVESYSLNFGVPGAVLLSLSQVAGGLALIELHPDARLGGWPQYAHAALAAAVVAASVALVIARSPRAASVFRAVVSAYLVLFYATLAAEHAARAFV
jgi:4-hydroxybenzoate polyprenyltransferase